MSLIQVKHLIFGYEGSYETLFDDVSLMFDTTFHTALIGRNAKGKTTFLKILLGKLDYQGEVIKSETCEYFPFEVKNQDDDTWDVCLDIIPTLEQWKLEKELRLLNIDIGDVLYRPFSTLSQGEQTKVLLALLFLKERCFLLIDEPTNHLDQQSRRFVARYLKKQKGFLLVSHDRFFIDQCCDHVIAMNRNSLEVVKGNFSSWYNNKKQNDEREKAQNKKLKKDIVRLEKSRRQSQDWANRVEKTKNGQRVSGLRPDRGYIGHKSAKMMKRSQNIERHRNLAIQKKEALLKDVEDIEDLKMCSLAYHQFLYLSLSHVKLFYPDQVICENLSFSLRKGDRLLLRGANGSGKSSVIALILQQGILYEGDLMIGPHLKISYVPQDCSDLRGRLDQLIDRYDVDQTLVKTILRKFDFARDDFSKKCEYLSQGQKKKVMLAISLACPAHLYIWDEPLNYIDIYSRIQLEKLILEYQPTLLFIEHDHMFQEKVATKIIDFM